MTFLRALEALKSTSLGQTTASKKPVLVRAFKPLGYDCRGGSGTFTLRRRTSGNLTVEINLDVGTWSRSLTGFFKVHGLLPLPVSRRAAGGGQYPIGDEHRWQQIVANLAALGVEGRDRGAWPHVLCQARARQDDVPRAAYDPPLSRRLGHSQIGRKTATEQERTKSLEGASHRNGR